MSLFRIAGGPSADFTLTGFFIAKKQYFGYFPRVFLLFLAAFLMSQSFSSLHIDLIHSAKAGSTLPPPTVGSTPAYANSPTSGNPGSSGNSVPASCLHSATKGDGGDPGPSVTQTVTPSDNGGGYSNIANVISNGGKGGSGGSNNTGACLNNAASGGNGGQGGAISLTVNPGSGNQGYTATGLYVSSQGGAGGKGGTNNVSGKDAGDGGNGGNGGAVSVTNGSAIASTGANSYGLWVQSLGGGGGTGGNATGVFYGSGGGGGLGGVGGSVSVSNTGAITSSSAASLSHSTSCRPTTTTCCFSFSRMTSICRPCSTSKARPP